MDGPDPAVVAAAAAGDPAAFETLVREMQGPVWRYILHLCGDAALAEDIAQEVFIRVHRRLHTLQSPTKFVSWVLTISRNATYDAGRRQMRRPLSLVGDDAVWPDEAPHDPHLSLEVHDALARLDEPLREAVVLIGMIGLSYEEAAAAIGVPEGTVKSRTFRARRQLMEMLSPGDDDDV